MKYKILGYLFLAVVGAAIVAGVYWWQYGQDRSQDEVCIQVIQRARNPQTGEIRDFSTPCDVPEGWEKISSEEIKSK